MQEIKIVSALALFLISALLMVEGAAVYIDSWGEVRGTEFSMLINLNKLVGMVLAWLAVFGLWSIAIHFDGSGKHVK